jgi:hypothetical protein
MSDEARFVQMAGKFVQCPLCGLKKFWKKEAPLNTKDASFFDFDFLNPSDDCNIRIECLQIV